MKQTSDSNGEKPFSFASLIFLSCGAAAGVWITAAVLPIALPDLVATLFRPQPTAFWFLARASAWAAYGMLWMSMMLGLMMTSKASRIWPGGPEAFDLHHFTSLFGLVLALFHGLIVVGDPYLSATLSQILIPFTFAPYRPEWIGFGQIGLYLLAVLCLSFSVRRWIKPRGWRLVHYLSFLTFAGVLLHGVMSGSDSAYPLAEWVYLVTGGSVVLGTLYRIIMSAVAPAPKRKPAAANIRFPAGTAAARVQSDPS
jgi:predicted ferric reductase